jgi:LysR family transcriptional regulator, hydrogen peroxide-inducible genes activator
MNSRLNFSLTQLEYVLAVHKFGHFAKAAEFCNITQPTLSMQIQKLEESLGTIIFDRTKKPILLTDTGAAIIEQIQQVVSEAKKIDSIIQLRGKDILLGNLTLGIIPTIAPYLLPRLLPILEKKYSGIRLQIKELQTHQIIESLNTDEIDVGLLAIPVHSPKVIEKSLYFEPFSVLCAKNHPLATQKKIKASTLKSDDIWLLEEGHCLRNQVLDVCSLKKEKEDKRPYKFESGSLETLKNLINSFGGYTLLPHLAEENIGKNSIVIEFEKPIPAREVGLVYRREHYKIELINAVAEAIQGCIPQEFKKVRPKDLDVLPID